MVACFELPSELSRMTQLECLGVSQMGEVAEDPRQEWFGTLGRALPRLTRLTTLALAIESAEAWDDDWDIQAIARLPRLQRLWLWHEFEAPYALAALVGPCLASLRWLALSWGWLQAAAPALRGAPQLEYVCALSTPLLGSEDQAAAWDAAWDWLATHPPLVCLAFESGGEPAPSYALLDALVALKARRPALHVRRYEERDDIPHYNGSIAYAQMMEARDVPAPPL